jgi:hypothetical protein
MDGSAKFMHWRLCRNERSRAGVALSPAAIAICWPGLCQYILCFTRPSCKRRSHGVPATLPTLTTVVRIFKNFSSRRSSIGSSHDAALELAANMAGARRGNREPERAATGPVGGVHGHSTLILALLQDGGPVRPLALIEALWQGSARSVGAFLADSQVRGTLP